MPINHAFTSAKSDGTDATLVRASNWNAPHLISGVMQLFVRKPADESRSTGGFADDAHLLFPIGANEVWHLHAFMFVTSAGISLAWAGPTGATLALAAHHSTGTFTWTVLNSNVTLSSGGLAIEGLVINGATAGNLRPNYQGSGGTVIVKANSTLWGARLVP